MKNLLAFLTLMVAGVQVAFAQAYADNQAMTVIKQPEPILIVGVYDLKQSPALLVPDAVLSKNTSTHRMCWQVESLNANTTYNIAEHILSPAPATFTDREAKNGRSPDGLYHRIIKPSTTNERGELQKCWQFDHTDPNGTYRMRVIVDDLAFPMRAFHVAD